MDFNDNDEKYDATAGAAATDGSTSTASSSYRDPSTNDLTLFTGAILLTADCMGTGILALPADIQTLGRGWGIGFLLLNLPINLYAGTVLGRCALYVERSILSEKHDDDDVPVEVEACCDDDDQGCNVNNNNMLDGEIDKNQAGEGGGGGSMETRKKIQQNKKQRRKKGYSSVDEHDSSQSHSVATGQHSEVQGNSLHERTDVGEDASDQMENPGSDRDGHDDSRHHQHTDTATFDFVGMTSMLFDVPILPTMSNDEFISDAAFDPGSTSPDDERERNHNSSRQRRQITYTHPLTKVVLAIYYINIFLVLGNYILVSKQAYYDR